MKVDRLVSKKPSMSSIILVATLVTIIPHWVWYGEKNLLNGVIMYLLFLLLYRISISFNNIFK